MSEMWINMGPQHPMTHGLWNLRVRIDGEIILDVDPEMGYLHRGIEKISEDRHYNEVITLMDRTCYVAGPRVGAPLHHRRRGRSPHRRARAGALDPHSHRRVPADRVAHHVVRGVRPGHRADEPVPLRDARPGPHPRPVPELHRRPAYLRVQRAWAASATTCRSDSRTGRGRSATGSATASEDTIALCLGSDIFHRRCDGLGVLKAQDCIDYGVTGPMLRLGRGQARPPEGPALRGLRPASSSTSRRPTPPTSRAATSSGWRSCANRSGSFGRCSTGSTSIPGPVIADRPPSVAGRPVRADRARRLPSEAQLSERGRLLVRRGAPWRGRKPTSSTRAGSTRIG